MKDMVWKANRLYCYRKLIMFNGRSARRRAVESRIVSLTADYEEKSSEIYGYDKFVVKYNDGSAVRTIGGERDAVSELFSAINSFCGGGKPKNFLHKEKLNSAYSVFDFVIDKKGG